MCFRKNNIYKLNFQYFTSKKGWMTRDIFKIWLKYFDSRINNRKVLLILDNFQGHILSENELNLLSLKNTRLVFLPANTTSRLQPLDAGIIAAFKKQYFQKYLKLVLYNIYAKVKDPYKINLYNCILISIYIWDNLISNTTIKNCFRHTSIESKEFIGPITQTVDIYTKLDLYYQNCKTALNLNYKD
jgi:hypothetical protein